MQKRLSSRPGGQVSSTNRNVTAKTWLPPVDAMAPNLSAHAKKAAARKRATLQNQAVSETIVARALEVIVAESSAIKS